MLGNQRIVFELGIGDLGTRLKDRVARIGNQNGVTRIEQGQGPNGPRPPACRCTTAP